MSLGDILLNDKTRVTINIATLAFVIGFSITATFTFTTWKTEFQMNQVSFEKEQLHLQASIEAEGAERAQADKDIRGEIQTNEIVLQENKTQLTDMEIKAEARHAEIQTNLKWIISAIQVKEQ